MEGTARVISKPKTLAEQLAEAKAENEALRQRLQNKTKMSYKVSEKGALSAYGLGRFPVTLYREQWERLLGQKDEILLFIQENADSLKVKE